MADFKDRSFPRTQGEQLVRAFIPGVLFLVFAILPLLGVVFLVTTFNFSQNFIFRLFYSIILAFCAGGFFVLGMNLWMTLDEFLINYMKEKWKSGPLLKKATFKVIIPEGSNIPVNSLVKFYKDLSPINPDSRNNYEKYYEGKSFYDVIYDYILEDGKVQMYITTLIKRKQLIESAFKKNFPEIQLLEVENPYAKWPKKWDERGDFFKDYGGMESADYQLLSKSPPFFTLGDPTWYADSANPLSNLFNSMLELDPKNKIIWQLVVRKTGHVDYNQWELDLAKMKSDTLSSNSQFSSGSNIMSTGDLITQDQKDFFNYLDATLADITYQCRLKLVVFYPPGKSFYNGMIEKMVKSYSLEIKYGNTIEKDWFTSTNRFFLRNGFLDTIVGPLANRFYHIKEIEFRRKAQYSGLLMQHLDMSHDNRANFVLGVHSLATLNPIPWQPTAEKIPEIVTEKEAEVEVEAAQTSSFNKLDEIRRIHQQSQKEKVEVIVNIAPQSPQPSQTREKQDLPDNLPT